MTKKDEGQGPRRLLTFHELRDAGVPYKSRSYVWRLEARGEFPKRVKIGAGRIAWVEKEIRAWVQKWIDARR
jgi:prophage regulatory protein